MANLYARLVAADDSKISIHKFQAAIELLANPECGGNLSVAQIKSLFSLTAGNGEAEFDAIVAQHNSRIAAIDRANYRALVVAVVSAIEHEMIDGTAAAAMLGI